MTDTPAKRGRLPRNADLDNATAPPRSHKSRWIGDAEQKARAVNEQPWEPLPGMIKRRCASCEFWCAFPARQRGELVCPDCQFLRMSGKEYGGRHIPSESSS